MVKVINESSGMNALDWLNNEVTSDDALKVDRNWELWTLNSIKYETVELKNV